MFQEEVTLTFIFQTIGVILVITALGIFLVKKKAKEEKEKQEAALAKERKRIAELAKKKTQDSLRSIEIAAKKSKEENLKTLSIVNVEGSTLYRECDENLLIHAGTEIGVASTKAFTQQVLVGLLLSKAFGSNIDVEALKGEFNLLSERVQDILDREIEIKNIAKNIPIVMKHLDGASIKKIIVVPKKIVNIVI